jgi:hypothetical protein
VVEGVDLLAVPVQGVLLLADLDGRTTELRNMSVSALAGVLQRRHTWGIRTRSPDATPMGTLLPSRSTAPGPTARTRPSLSSLTLDSGRKMPDAVLVSALTR